MSNHSRIKRISGWLAWQDFQIMRLLIINQSRSANAIVEIGVHHGKSAIAMAEVAPAKKIYVVDVFGKQELNIDQSGNGDKAAFLRNLQAFGIDRSRVTIDERLSSDVTPNDISAAVGPVDFFHIDGGHHHDAVSSDLDLALATLSPNGIIAIDDTFRPEWPDVTLATFSHQNLIATMTMFAIGYNKSYWCRKSDAERYKDILLADKDLGFYLRKEYKADSGNILVFQRYPLPEWPLSLRWKWMFSVYSPEFYVAAAKSPALTFCFRVMQKVKRIVRFGR